MRATWLLCALCLSGLALGRDSVVADDSVGKTVLAIEALSVTPKVVRPREAVSISGIFVNDSSHEVEVAVVPVAHNKRFEVLRSDPVGPTRIPPGGQVSHSSSIQFHETGATRVGLAAVGPAGFSDPVTNTVIVADGSERVWAVLAILASVSFALALSWASGRLPARSRFGADGRRLGGLMIAALALTLLLTGWLRTEAVAYRPVNGALLVAGVLSWSGVVGLAVVPLHDAKAASLRAFVGGGCWASTFVMFPILVQAPLSAIALEGLALVVSLLFSAWASFVRLRTSLGQYLSVVGCCAAAGWWMQAAVLRLVYGGSFVL